MPITYEPIATTTLGSAAASVTFSTISGAYTDLVLVIIGGTVTADGYYGVTFNSDTGTNYSNTQMVGNGSTATSNSNSNSSIMYIHSTSESTVGKDTIIVNIQNYSNTTTYKTVLARGNSSGYRVTAAVDLWRSTSAITSMQITAGSNLLSGSTFTLYGIKAA